MIEKFLKEGNGMDEISNKILEIGLGKFMNNSREKLVKRDSVYQEKEKKLADMERAYVALDLPVESRKIVDDYISQGEELESKYADISYMAGMKDAFILLSSLGLLRIDIG